ncbi:MAG: sensor histidine kinase, partial [Terriglobales bacterium]
TLLSAGAVGDLSKDAHELVTTAENEIERLTKLVNDLLDVAKIEAGKMDMSLQEIAIQPVIKRSISSVGNFAEQHGVALQTEECAARVVGDPERLIQVLINLISNAVKFSAPQSTVSITAKPVDDGWLEVRVTDHGRGVPPEHREAIFQRFHQVEGTDATEKRGTGLGLPICKTIIDQHGGTIGVESEVGKGSSFWFRIPLVVPARTNGATKEGAAAKISESISRAGTAEHG